ncbi:unnamed protein product [Dracunculus medinensis]|uniref:Protein FAM136A n=1 Tax=Dracunculus medinensis TaxID=318479 RepID=A0A0N4U9Y2_DRAME|nr:unnamed protein product [Dracunculus medinensis]
MRDIQKKMFICSSHCCEDNSISREEVETCIDRCNASMKKIQNVIEKELTAFQGQLSRCALSCYDRLVQKYGPEPEKYKAEETALFSSQLEKCVSTCADDHVKLLPQIKERILKNI